MKKLLFLLSVPVMLAFLASCDCIQGNGHVVTKSAKVGTFTSIDLQTDADVELVNDSSSTIYINGESNIIENVKFDIQGGKLKIWSDECFSNHETIKLKVPIGSSKLEEVKLSGSGEFRSSAPVKSDKVSFILNGSGDIDLAVDGGEVYGKINGSGRLALKGNAKSSEMVINGSGDIDASDLVSENAKADINGSGNCKVNATGSLKATIRGSGDIYYKGTATVSTSIMGSGSVNKME